MKKASKYSKICDADVCVGIHIQETGQVHILSADASGFWAFLTSQLVSCGTSVHWKKADLPGLPLPSSKFDYRPWLGKDWGRHKCYYQVMNTPRCKWYVSDFKYVIQFCSVPSCPSPIFEESIKRNPIICALKCTKPLCALLTTHIVDPTPNLYSPVIYWVECCFNIWSIGLFYLC